MKPRWRSKLWTVLPALLAGCVVHTYQPIHGLGSPVVVDPAAPNFEDLSITVTCIEGDYLSRQETNTLCRQLGLLFERQGATVATVGARGAFGPDTQSSGEQGPAVPQTDLSMEVRSRRVHRARYPLTWVTHVASFTVLPYVTEHSFAQDVTIRDEQGFLLVEASLQGRIVKRAGTGTWLGNKVLDWLVREDGEKLTGPHMANDLSADVYGQISQLAYNAKLRRQTLVPLVVAPSDPEPVSVPLPAPESEPVEAP